MIYCVEDDSSIRELMVYTLRASGYEAEGFEEAASFWEKMKQSRPDLIMLDIMLPDEDGISILKELRASPVTAELPVILATAKGTEYDKVIGLDLGADDYLAKPFGMMEMVSRIRAVLRRCNKQADHNVLHIGNIILNKTERKVLNGQDPVELTYKEFEILSLFMEHPGRVFSRDDILNAVWGSDYLGESRTIDVHIGTLRTKLGDSGNLIKTVRGIGYRLETEA